MRILFFTGNIALFLLAIILAYMNIRFRNSPSDPILKNTPNPEVFKIENKIQTSKDAPDFSQLWNDNIFSPFRMKEDGDSFASLKPTGLELIGVCSYGDNAGAIILDRGGQTAYQQFPISSRQVNQQQTATPQFYKLNDSLPNGFILKEVNFDSVVLTRGKEQIILQIDFEDDGSVKRTENLAKTHRLQEKPKLEAETNIKQVLSPETKDENAQIEIQKTPVIVPPVPPSSPNPFGDRETRRDLPAPGQIVR